MKHMNVLLLLSTSINSAPCTAQEFESLQGHITSRVQIEALESTSLGAADTIPPRSLLPLALDVIKEYEAWVPRAYNDASKYCTIGFGHLIALKPCASVLPQVAEYNPPISKAAGLTLLDGDTAVARRAVKRHVNTQLTDEQFGALSSFVFNVGEANFANSTLRRYLAEGDFKRAARQFGRWVSSKGIVLNGLINRRACEAALFENKLSFRADGKFYREDCEALGALPANDTLVDVESGEIIQ